MWLLVLYPEFPSYFTEDYGGGTASFSTFCGEMRVHSKMGMDNWGKLIPTVRPDWGYGLARGR